MIKTFRGHSAAYAKDLKNFGLETIVDGQKRQELEYTFYGKLGDFSVLDSEIVTKREEQEQYHIPIDSDHIGMRIRRTNTTNFVQTVKAKREGVKGKEEVEQEITEDTFNLLRESATTGYRKTRYFIQVPDSELVWEIDVFTDTVEQKSPWIKLDLEVPSADTVVPDLPFPLVEKIVAQGDRKTEAEEMFLDNLWNREWNILNDVPPITGSKEEDTGAIPVSGDKDPSLADT